MSITRISLSTHGAAELLLGLALVVLPFVLGLAPAVLVATMVAGALLAGVGLSSTVDALAPRAHRELDMFLAAACVVLAIAVALAGGGAGAALLAAAAAAEMALIAGTRWIRR
jgi:hypothetical protein